MSTNGGEGFVDVDELDVDDVDVEDEDEDDVDKDRERNVEDEIRDDRARIP